MAPFKKSNARERLRELRKNGVGKFVSVEQAVALVHDGDTLATGGFVSLGLPEYLHLKLEERFLSTKAPKDLTIFYAAGQGSSNHSAMDHYAHEGMVKRVVGGHWALIPEMQKLAFDNKIEAYNLPQGVLSHLFRAIAGHKPGILTTVGLGTFVDPRFGGGKVSEKAKEDIVRLMEIDGDEYLFYKTCGIDVAFIRGTTADEDGNITMEKEALTTEVLSIAMATKNAGGIVVVQVEQVAQRNTLSARNIKIPGVMVDFVVVSPPEHHMQSAICQYNPAFSGEIKVPLAALPPLEMSERKIIARRAALELVPDAVLNLGIGMPEGVADVAAEEGVSDMFTLTAEPGSIGGIPAGGKNFGASTNPITIIDQPYQFDFYDGGGVDCTFLGLAQADEQGNLNVSKFGPKLAGAGGFINISSNSKKVVFVGTFTTGGLKVEVKDGKLVILSEGKVKKLVKEVEHRTFSGEQAVKKDLPVLYITERCVFKLTKEGMELIEVAPGVDVEKDILAYMDFKPIVKNPKLMDARIFTDKPMGLRADILAKL